MKEKRYVEVTALEKEGWFLCRQAQNKRGLAAMETKQLRSVPAVRLKLDVGGQDATQTDTQSGAQKAFAFPPTFRDQDENGKTVCRRCGKRLGAAKTAYCPGCGGEFVEEADEQ